MASHINGVSFVCSTICSGTDRRKHESSAAHAFVRGIHLWLVDFPHKGPVTRQMLLFDDVIMSFEKGMYIVVEFVIFADQISVIWRFVLFKSTSGVHFAWQHYLYNRNNQSLKAVKSVPKSVIINLSSRMWYFKAYFHNNTLACVNRLTACW